MLQKKTRQVLIKALILFTVAGTGFQAGARFDGRPDIAYARSLYLTTQSLSLYTGRSSSTERVTTIPSRQAVDVLSVYDGGAWAKVRWNGNTGYLRTMYLKLTRVSDGASPTPSATPTNPGDALTGQSLQSDGYHMYASDALAFRKTASREAVRLGTVPAGADLLIIDRSGAYFKVLYNGRYGWVSAAYCRDYVPGSPAPAKTPPKTVEPGASSTRSAGTTSGQSLQSDGYHMYTKSQTTLRKSPSVSAANRARLAARTDLLIIDQSGSWYKVYYNKAYGWVKKAELADYSRTTGGTAAKPQGSSNSSTGQGEALGSSTMTTRRSVRLLAGPNKNFSSRGQVPAGARVAVLDDWGYYVKVSYQGKTGYIHMTDLKKPKNYQSPAKNSSGGSTAPDSGSGVSGQYQKPVSATRSADLRIRDMKSYGDTNIAVTGTINDLRVSRINVYLNGTYLGKANHQGSAFSYTIPSGVTLPGSNTLRIEATTSRGVLYQTDSFSVKKVPTILIDPGHGGYDPGAIGTHNGVRYFEKDYDLKFAANLKKELTALGFEVKMTRTGDRSVNNSERAALARRYDADLVFSMHHNAAAKGASGGLTIYPSLKYAPSTQAAFSESKLLAQMLARAYAAAGMTYKGAYQDIQISGHTLYLMRNTQTRTVLTEMGFITSPRDIRLITSPAFQAELPRQMAKTIYQFFYGR